MAIFTNLSLKYKILAIALVGALGFTTYVSYNYVSALKNEQRLTKIQTVNFPILDNIGIIWLELFAARTAMQTAIGEGELEVVEEARQHQNTIVGLFEKIRTLEPRYVNHTDNLNKKLSTYMLTAENLTLGMIQGTLALSEMSSKAQQMNQHYDVFKNDLGLFREKALKDFAHRLDSATKESQMGVVYGMLLGIAVIIILVSAAWTIAAIITSNLNRIIKELAGMAVGKGDLTIRLKTSARDEIGELVNKFNAFITHLQLMVKVLANLAIGVTGRTEDVRKIALHTHQGIIDQQHEIQQVATAVTEMAQTAIEVSRNAGEASTATEQADSESQNGQRVVKDNIQAITSLADDIEEARSVIQNLSDQVQKIASASQVIRSIADQTNLLALNAAIEAARAGEQGRGFAVVADEVRTLAGRTGQSTNEIEEIIGSLLNGALKAVEVMDKSKERALESVNQSKSTGESLQSILGSIHTINEMNLLVANSAQEQSSVAESVSRNIERINHVSEQTVEDAQATTDASNNLSEQAEQLRTIVNEFQV